MKSELRRDRVIKAMEHKCSDIVPHFCEFTEQARNNLLVHLEDDFENKLFNNHLYYKQYWGWPTELDKNPGYYRDEYGVTWNRSGVDKDIGVVDTPIIFRPDMSLYIEPLFNEKRFRTAIEDVVSLDSDQFKFFGIGFSLFERAWSYLTMEEALYNMAAEESFMHNLFDRICQYNLKLIDIINEYPIDAVYFGDDWGQQKGTLMGPNNWRKFIKPHLEVMYRTASKNDKYIIQHSCGDISEILPDLIDIGLDCYQTFQTEIYDMNWFKREYGKDLSIWGGISTQQLLSRGTPQEVQQETIKVIRTMSKDGGYIAAPTHAIAHDVSIQNIIAMQEVFQNQNMYL